MRVHISSNFKYTGGQKYKLIKYQMLLIINLSEYLHYLIYLHYVFGLVYYRIFLFKKLQFSSILLIIKLIL